MKDEYTTICDTCYRGTWYEEVQPCKRMISHGCPNCGSHQYISEETPCTGTLRIIDRSGLDNRFKQFFDSGERIEVTYDWGEKERFYVRRSTDWKPCWIALKKRNSYGGGALLQDSIVDIKPIGVFL